MGEAASKRTPAQMTFNDLLRRAEIDPATVILLRHRPSEREFRRKLPWLAANEPELYNDYQRGQNLPLENSMKELCGEGYIASFIASENEGAMFVGLYKIGREAALLSPGEAAERSKALRAYGANIWEPDRPILYFDLQGPMDFCADWQGKLIVDWPGGMRSWWRRAQNREYPIRAILEESLLVEKMPPWNELVLSWDDLKVLPRSWQEALSQWRGIYYIFDATDGKGYVGSAYGEDNLWGRWRNYKQTGHGGNKLLRQRRPDEFRFSILELTAISMNADDVIRLESTWKERLHTRAPHGLNDN